MTLARVLLLGCALMAVLAGAWLEAIGIVAIVVVLFLAWPDGVAQRPVPFHIWFGPGRWRGPRR